VPSSPLSGFLSRVLLTAAATGLLATGCGGTTPATSSCAVAVTGGQGQKPAITVPDCAAPTTLQTTDVIPGTGPEVTAGSTATVDYTLVEWETKKSVESSYDNGVPFSLRDVGQAAVIQGWNEGLVGMRQGGRRLLVVPPDKGYGADPGNPLSKSTLVFVVDAVTVTSAK